MTSIVKDNDGIISTRSQEIKVTCDFNHDGIIISDYNDLMHGYKCFIGITDNCGSIYQNWNLIKEEYECFANSR